MAVFEQRTRIEEFTEFVLPNPTNLAEFMKAVVAAEGRLSGQGIFDNTIQIRSDDEEIVVFFKENAS